MRIVIGLREGADEPAVRHELLRSGAVDVRPSSPSLPGVIVAESGPTPPEDVIEAALRLPDVRYAEPDAPRATFE